MISMSFFSHVRGVRALRWPERVETEGREVTARRHGGHLALRNPRHRQDVAVVALPVEDEEGLLAVQEVFQ